MKESIQRGAFTSFQPMGASVNDYCCVSSTLLSRVPDSALHSEESHTESYTWSDHAQLNLSIAQSEHLASQISVAVEEPSHPFIFDDPTPLDIPLKSRLESAVSSDEATARLYGDVSSGSPAQAVYLATASTREKAAFANGSNDSIAAILAVLCAAKECPADQQLTIYSASQYAIRSFCYWACDHETEGWSCTNGLILRDSVEWLAQRTAAVEFRWVSTTEPNKSMIESASTVTTTLEEVSEPKGQPPPPISADEVVDDDEGHRGRKRYGGTGTYVR
ncbi:RNA-directed DNA polymerase from mobile element jockey [Favolaschia claudopus]|uniref:RNA-directed DNA polymerase from mobile element jockey n=1 Tax=Favolaschia claudopus TaxID=2862362 RepID=A0AAW0BX97_9AGAR